MIDVEGVEMAQELNESSRSSDEEQDGEDEIGAKSEDEVSADSGQKDGLQEADSDDEYESDREAQRIGSSVLRFARRCVKKGDHCEALAALMKVVEISDLASEPCRRALLFAAQVLSVTAQEERAIRCLTELWTWMPSPYITRDAQLIIGTLYDRLGEPRIRDYWFKRAFGNFLTDPTTIQRAWLSLANRSYDEGDYILSNEAFSRVFASAVESQCWPKHLSTFRFVGRFLTSLVSVAQVDGDQHFNRQNTAFALAVSVLQSDATPLHERVWDSDYLLVRGVFLHHFPTIHSYLFSDEDDFIGRIQRAWRTYAARRERRKAIGERNQRRAEELEGRRAARKAKSKPEAKKRSKAVLQRANDEVATIRCKTKARIQSLQQSSQPKKKTIAAKSVATAILEDEMASKEHAQRSGVSSPTRRKLEEVKRMRERPLQTEGQTMKVPSDNQVSPSSPTSPLRTLLDVYRFPTLDSDRVMFEGNTGRPHGAADLDDDLDAIEAFARLAHYRSRVIASPKRATVHDVDDLSSDTVAPEWLKRYNDVLTFIRTHESRQQPPQAPVSTLASHFSQIHSRVLYQLTSIHQKYVLQFGKTMFSIKLSHLVRRIEMWHFTSVSDEIIRVMEDLKSLGEEEEAQRNLEFYHVHTVRRAEKSTSGDASTT